MCADTIMNYTSCVVINGRPILPPVMTQPVVDEMRLYRDMAVAVELKLSRFRHRSELHLGAEIPNNHPYEPLAGPNFDTDVVLPSTYMTKPSTVHHNGDCSRSSLPEEVTQPRCVMDCEGDRAFGNTPSVASTGLTKYMTGRSSSSVSHPYSVESGRPDTGSTLVHVSPVPSDVKEEEEEEEEEEFQRASFLLRRNSYTLDRPSQVLLSYNATVGYRANDSADLPSDGSNTKSEDAASPDQERGDKQRHLHRYLNQMAFLSMGDRICDVMVDERASEIKETASNELSREVGQRDWFDNAIESPYFFDDMKREQMCQFFKLKADLEQSHHQQMEQLRAQFGVDLDYLNRKFDGGDGGSDGSNVHHHADTISDNGKHTITDAPPSLCQTESGGSTSYVSAESSPRQNKKSPGRIDGWSKRGFGQLGYDNLTNSCVDPRQCEDDYLYPSLDEEKKKEEPLKNNEIDTPYHHLSAAVKGYLTRRLLRTEKVRGMIEKITDTLKFAIKLRAESPIGHGHVTPEDITLRSKVIAQLTAACRQFHDVFALSSKERMAIIARDRQLQRDKRDQLGVAGRRSVTFNSSKPTQNVSSATLKVIERRRHRMSCSGGWRGSGSSVADKIMRVSGKSKCSPSRDHSKVVTRRALVNSGRALSASPQLSNFTARSPPHIRSQSSLCTNLFGNHLLNNGSDNFTHKRIPVKHA